MIIFANLLIAWILKKNGKEIWDSPAPAPDGISGIPSEQSVILPCFVEF
jgi:hypothetical protein